MIISQKQLSGAVPQKSCSKNFNKMLDDQTYRYLQQPKILVELIFKDFANILIKFLKTGRIDHTWEGQLFIPRNICI